MSIVWLIAFLTILLIAGLVLLIRGLRGRVIDDHPLCRACGFDLFGLPAGVTKCSECGADISGARATRIGHRQRRPGMALLGSLLILPMLAGVGIWGWGTIRHVNWIAHVPYWYVVRQSNSAVVADRDAALTELLRRLLRGRLSEAQVTSLVDSYLKVQADLNVPWLTQYGDFIGFAHSRRKISKQQWARYLSNAVQYSLIVRPRVRRGDDLIAKIVQGKPRTGIACQIIVSTPSTLEGSDLLRPGDSASDVAPGRFIDVVGGGDAIPLGKNWFSWFPIGSYLGLNLSCIQRIKLDSNLVAHTGDGPKALEVTMLAKLYDHDPNGASPPDAIRRIHLKANWTLVDTPTVRPINDPDLRPQMEKAISIGPISASPMGPGHYIDVTMPVRWNHLPAPESYDVFLRAQGREWPLGSVAANAWTSNSTRCRGGFRQDAFTATMADVVLRPDPAPALGTIDMTQYWDGEIVIKNVPVEWPTTRPGGK
jgi:hypothetical protein